MYIYKRVYIPRESINLLNTHTLLNEKRNNGTNHYYNRVMEIFKISTYSKAH
jgi:hypothetical protein